MRTRIDWKSRAETVEVLKMQETCEILQSAERPTTSKTFQSIKEDMLECSRLLFILVTYRVRNSTQMQSLHVPRQQPGPTLNPESPPLQHPPSAPIQRIP
jgi:hypothetical protein